MIASINMIISGGQTGVDRAALDWAILNNIKHGGWCPKGRLAEDGKIPSIYQLKESHSDDYSVRTELNVIDSDATLIISTAEIIAGGTLLTKTIAARNKKPCLHIYSKSGIRFCANLLRDFIEMYKVSILNIAGPRESEDQKIRGFVLRILDVTFKGV